MENKNGKMSVGGGIALAAGIVLVGLLMLAFIPQSQTNVPGVDPETGVACDSTTTPSFTIDAYDKENVGTALTEATNLYREVGKNSWSTFTAGTAFDASALSELEVIMGISTTDFTDNNYGQSFNVVVPCSENPSIEKEMAVDEIETSVTATFYNADGSAAAETFTAGEVQTLSVKVKAGVDEYFGNPYLPSKTPNVMVFEINSTYGEKPVQVYLADGTELKSVSVPTRLAAVAGKIMYAYEMPVITDKQIEIFFDYQADATNAPDSDDTIHLFAANWFVNSDTGQLEWGVENEDAAAVGTDAADTVTIDLTA